jgi:hypothetical protein
MIVMMENIAKKTGINILWITFFTAMAHAVLIAGIILAIEAYNQFDSHDKWGIERDN